MRVLSVHEPFFFVSLNKELDKAENKKNAPALETEALQLISYVVLIYSCAIYPFTGVMMKVNS